MIGKQQYQFRSSSMIPPKIGVRSDQRKIYQQFITIQVSHYLCSSIILDVKVPKVLLETTGPWPPPKKKILRLYCPFSLSRKHHSERIHGNRKTPKRWSFRFRGNDKPRGMGVENRHRILSRWYISLRKFTIQKSTIHVGKYTLQFVP